MRSAYLRAVSDRRSASIFAPKPSARIMPSTASATPAGAGGGDGTPIAASNGVAGRASSDTDTSDTPPAKLCEELVGESLRVGSPLGHSLATSPAWWSAVDVDAASASATATHPRSSSIRFVGETDPHAHLRHTASAPCVVHLPPLPLPNSPSPTPGPGPAPTPAPSIARNSAPYPSASFPPAKQPVAASPLTGIGPNGPSWAASSTTCTPLGAAPSCSAVAMSAASLFGVCSLLANTSASLATLLRPTI
mmetsp:Transcript_6706/g.29545  ORF Transcript_6706/g.29545 Transcript_6706/m.29545 type:complete len:250 (-) Transcript_6706:506-1255(-)